MPRESHVPCEPLVFVFHASQSTFLCELGDCLCALTVPRLHVRTYLTVHHGAKPPITQRPSPRINQFNEAEGDCILQGLSNYLYRPLVFMVPRNHPSHCLGMDRKHKRLAGFDLIAEPLIQLVYDSPEIPRLNHVGALHAVLQAHLESVLSHCNTPRLTMNTMIL